MLNFFDWLGTTQGSIALHESIYMFPLTFPLGRRGVGRALDRISVNARAKDP